MIRIWDFFWLLSENERKKLKWNKWHDQLKCWYSILLIWEDSQLSSCTTSKSRQCTTQFNWLLRTMNDAMFCGLVHLKQYSGFLDLQVLFRSPSQMIILFIDVNELLTDSLILTAFKIRSSMHYKLQAMSRYLKHMWMISAFFDWYLICWKKDSTKR